MSIGSKMLKTLQILIYKVYNTTIDLIREFQNIINISL